LLLVLLALLPLIQGEVCFEINPNKYPHVPPGAIISGALIEDTDKCADRSYGSPHEFWGGKGKGSCGGNKSPYPNNQKLHKQYCQHNNSRGDPGKFTIAFPSFVSATQFYLFNAVGNVTINGYNLYGKLVGTKTYVGQGENSYQLSKLLTLLLLSRLKLFSRKRDVSTS